MIHMILTICVRSTGISFLSTPVNRYERGTAAVLQYGHVLWSVSYSSSLLVCVCIPV